MSSILLLYIHVYTMNGPKCVTTRPIDLENSVLRTPSVFIEDSILYSIRVHFAAGSKCAYYNLHTLLMVHIAMS